MSLEQEIKKASQEIVKDGYDMSIGEIINLYRDQELVIDPEFQRYFRWDITRKTRFIESLLLGIPIPPVFVFQREDGVWELIDGLQRLSTIFELVGILTNADGDIVPPLVLEGTKLLPSLEDKKWTGGESGLSKPQQLEIKRARIRVEILTKDSDQQSKYELFQRLNTGGATLTEQEVRNCIMVKINPSFYRWIKERTELESFAKSINISDNSRQKQKDIELVLRFFVLLYYPYKGGIDVNEHLDDGMYHLATSTDFDLEKNKELFNFVFELVYKILGEEAFKKFNGEKFGGQFLISSFESISYGLSSNYEALSKLAPEALYSFVEDKVKSMWDEEEFIKYSGAGVRGTTRLLSLIPFAKRYFKYE